MILIGYMPPIKIQLPVDFESPEKYGWKDFPPPLQYQFDPVFRSSPAAPEQELVSRKEESRPTTTTVESHLQHAASSSSSSQNKNKQKTLKIVKFGSVQIREHALTVGAHDWCDGHLPLTLDWKHTQTRSIGIDDFEWMRERQGRTSKGNLPKMDYLQRKQVLRRVSGLSETDIASLEQRQVDLKYVDLKRSTTVAEFPSEA